VSPHLSQETKAILHAAEALTTEVRRVADALTTPAVQSSAPAPRCEPKGAQAAHPVHTLLAALTGSESLATDVACDLIRGYYDAIHADCCPNDHSELRPGYAAAANRTALDEIHQASTFLVHSEANPLASEPRKVDDSSPAEEEVAQVETTARVSAAESGPEEEANGEDQGQAEAAPEDGPTPDQHDARQPAYDAVLTLIRDMGDLMPSSRVRRNAMIWRAVNAALDATPVGRCISSHCVEGDHILPVGGPS
jgi:hypothetical protein